MILIYFFILLVLFIFSFLFFGNNGDGNLAITSRFKVQKYHNIPRLGRHKSFLVTKDSLSFFSFLLSHCLPVKLLYQSVGSSRSLFSFKNRLIFSILSLFENYSNPFETRMYEEANLILINISSVLQWKR